MTHSDNKRQKQKKFLNLPKYPGGTSAFKRFISDNLIYPEKALKNKIEGYVHVKFVVDNLGKVIDATVTKGLGYGCDEETLRLVKLLKYEKAKNRGVRVSSKIRTRILFKIDRKKSNIQVQYNTSKEKQPEEKKDPDSPATYSYTIKY